MPKIIDFDGQLINDQLVVNENPGLMPCTDKEKLDGIEEGANNYIHPNDANTRHVTDTQISTWNAKASNTLATQTANGLMSSSDKTKLDGIASNANNYTHPSSHVATMITEDSSHRFVTDTEKNTWNAKASTAIATTSANGLMSSTDKSKLDGIATGANKYTLPTASSSTLGGVKTTSTVTSNRGLTACPIIDGVPYYKDTKNTYSLSSFGVSATAAELNYTSGVTSNIQTQLNAKADSIHSHSYLPLTGGTVSGALTVNRDSTSDSLFTVSNTNGAVALLSSSNYGLYDKLNNRWMMKVDTTTNKLTFDNNLYFGQSGTNLSNYTFGTYYADGDTHGLISKNNDGLTVTFGWAGSSSYKTVTNITGQTVQCKGSTTWSSDENLKYDFKEFDDRYDILFNNLKPISYKYILGSSGRNHSGYVTQNVEEALEIAGLTTKEFAGVVITPINGRDIEEGPNGEIVDVAVSESNYLLDKGITEQHNLAYTEFIALNTWQIQKLKSENKELKELVNSLIEKVTVLEDLLK